MRLRIVVPRYGEMVAGGSEGLAQSLAQALTARRWDVEVWTTTATDESTWANALPAGETLEDGIRVLRFRTVLSRRPRAFHQASRLFFRLPPAIRPERAWLLAQGPVAPGLIRALRLGRARPTLFTPYLFHPTVAGSRRAPHPRLLIPAAHDEMPLRMRAVGRAIASMDGLLYGTPEERQLLENAHPAARALPSRTGTVGVDPSPDADGARFRAAHGVRGPYLVSGGRAATGKGIGELKDGMRRLCSGRPDVSLVLTGEAGTGVAASPGVLPVGHLTRAQLWDAMAGAEGVVVPSMFESLSLMALEAWSLGRPCLLNGASPVLQGHAERGGGALCYRGSEGLAAAAGSLLGDPAMRRRLGEAGRDYVRAVYNWDGVAERLTDLIERPHPA